MRTKSLLAAAAILAAGLATSLAQSNVYSLNVVGYVNQVSPPAGFSMIANPLNTTNNTLPFILQNARLGMILYKFSAGFVASSHNGVAWSDPSFTMNPGEGAFLFVPAGIPYTNTYVGEVLQGSLTNPVPAGFALLGSKVPQTGGLTSALGYPPGLGTIAYKWAPGFDAFSHNGVSWSPSEPSLAVAEGFFSFKPTGAGTNWVRNFTVQ